MFYLKYAITIGLGINIGVLASADNGAMVFANVIIAGIFVADRILEEAI